MTTALQSGGGGGLARSSASSLADVLDTILDRGLVIDAYVRVSLVGIEILTIDARVVVASVDTYLRFAKAVNRLDIDAQKPGIPEMIEGITTRGAKSKTEGVLEGLGDKLNEILGSDADPERVEAVGQQLLQQLTEGDQQKNTTTNRRRTK